MEDIAAGADKEVAKNFLRILKKQGLKFEMRQKVTKATVNGDGVDVTIEQRDGGAVRTERFEKVDRFVVFFFFFCSEMLLKGACEHWSSSVYGWIGT
jgi:hypothetical protein